MLRRKQLSAARDQCPDRAFAFLCQLDLDATHQIAFLDPITQLPNSVVAEREMSWAIQQTERSKEAFSILFIDGDNLRFTMILVIPLAMPC